VPKATKRRQELLGRLEIAGRELSAVTVLFHDAVSTEVGLSAVEEKAIDVVAREGPLTARELTERLGLAPASVTALITRLEKKRFLQRANNPEDGRSVLLRVRPDGLKRLGAYFNDFAQALVELYERYTDEELELIVEFMTEATLRQRRAAEKIRKR
jgi:DNA-binding MarR family transcriptional regulator